MTATRLNPFPTVETDDMSTYVIVSKILDMVTVNVRTQNFATGWTTLGTLPTVYRPDSERHCPMIRPTDGVPGGMLRVQPSGALGVYNGTGAAAQLAGFITFRA